MRFPDGVRQVTAFLLRIFKRLVSHRRPCLTAWLNVLRKTLPVVADQLSRRRDDLRRAPVIDIQRHRLRFRIILREAQHDFRTRAAEPVDGLIVVPDNEEVVLRRRQHPDHLILKRTDILKFIHEDILKPALPLRKFLRSFAEQLITFHNDIVKINPSVLILPLLVLSVNLPERLLRHDGRIKPVDVSLRRLHTADLPRHLLRQLVLTGGAAPGVVQDLADQLHPHAVRQNAARSQIHHRPENAVIDGMEGPEHHLRGGGMFHF